MGGLKKELPVVYWTFLIGSASLAALPLVTAGFYSKDQIVWLALAGERGNGWLYLAALTGAFLTALYTFRMVFITFWGKTHTSVSSRPGTAMVIPLVILAFFYIVTGFLALPHKLGHITLFSGFLSTVLPVVQVME